MSVQIRMKQAGLRLGCALMVAWWPAQAVHAQIYKWVDEKGKTHYSNNKEDAERPKAKEMAVKTHQRISSPVPAPATAPQPSRTELPMDPPGAGPARPPRSVSMGREDGTDASRCALARDVLNGSVAHRNGKPIDKYDLDVAQNDVKMFCR